MTTDSFEEFNLSKGQNGILVFPDMPDFEIYLKAYAIPSVALGTTQVATQHIDDQLPSHKLTYDPLIVTFLVDEKFKTQAMLMEWMLQARAYKDDWAKNVTLKILSNKGNILRDVKFIGMYPFSLGEIQFDLNDDFEIINTATLNYTCYEWGDLSE
jgi:hypothetical protein